MPNNIQLSALSFSLKILVTSFIVALAVAYSIALLQVRDRTRLNVSQTVMHYRGSPEDREMNPPQSSATMISVAHVHSFSQPLVLVLLGFIFALTGLKEGTKAGWILASFIASLCSNGSPWLIREVSTQFVLLLYISGGVMMLAFLVMTARILKELWFIP